jgi:hypothetical protein
MYRVVEVVEESPSSELRQQEDARRRYLTTILENATTTVRGREPDNPDAELLSRLDDFFTRAVTFPDPHTSGVPPAPPSHLRLDQRAARDSARQRPRPGPGPVPPGLPRSPRPGPGGGKCPHQRPARRAHGRRPAFGPCCGREPGVAGTCRACPGHLRTALRGRDRHQLRAVGPGVGPGGRAQIDVLEIRDPSPVLGLSEEALRGRRLALLQTALLEHAAAYNLRTVMTFHQKVEEATAFAEALPKTAAELYVTETDDATMVKAEKELPASSIDAEFYGLEAGRHVPPNRVWSAWLCGDHLVSERREALRQFANGIDANNRRVHRAFLASVRVLGEGVDITGERGVEAICFADTRGSQVEIVQNIGRALRLNRDGSTKVARIIVPIFLEPGKDPTDMVASASFKPLVAVLQGLRSHDERLVEQLASRALTSGKRKVHVQRDEDGRIIGAGGEGDGEDQEHDDTQAAAESALLHFSTPRDAATIAAFLRTRVYRPDSLVWLEGYQALLRWRAENEITGLYAVPYDTETTVGVTKDFPLGRWVHQQRKALRAGELEPRRKELLDAPEAGMVWEPGEEAWETKLAALRSYHRATGHLAPRQDQVWGEGEAMVPVGQHMANLRRKGGLGKDQEQARERAQQLEAIDPDWNCPWPLDWQRHYRVLADLVDADGSLPEIQPGVLMDGDDIGRWLQRQKQPATWAQLSTDQQERLSRLGIKPLEAPSPAPTATRATKGPGKAQQAFQRGLAALAQWVEREGSHRPVPRGHGELIAVDGETEPVVVKLGVWVSNTKARRDRLTRGQLDALRELGMEWA